MGNITGVDVISHDEDDYISGGKETAFQVLNSDIEEKGPAYVWLDQGAEQLLDRY